MDRTIIDVPVISAGLRRLGAPVSALVRSGGMLYTCGMPPIDLNSGEIVRGDITTQTRAALEALAFALDFGGPDLQRLLIDPEVDLAPAPSFGAAMPAGMSLTFALDLDAHAVDQQVQRPLGARSGIFTARAF